MSRELAPRAELAWRIEWGSLYPFQQAAVQQGVHLRRHTLLAHAPGLGKTPMALKIAQQFGGSVTVVCPPAVVDQWERQFGRWYPEVRPTVIRTGMEAQSLLTLNGPVIISDALVHRLSERCRGALLILDEVHRFKQKDALRTRRVFGGRQVLTDRASPRWQGLTQTHSRTIALTGTPVLNSPIELYPLLRRLVPEIAPSWREFTARYCPPTQRFIAAINRTVTVYEHGTHLDELATRLRGSILIRPDAEQALGQLPPVVEEVVMVDCVDPGCGMMSVTEVAACFAPLGDGVPVNDGPANDPVVAELRRLTGLAKAEAAIPWLQTLVESGARPLIWCHHREVAERLSDALLVRGQCVHGGRPPMARDAIVQSFKLGHAPCLVATLGTLGTGVDGLQHATRCCVFVERSYVPADNEQAVARIHRAGQTRGTLVYRIDTRTPIDQGIILSLARKSRMIQELLA